MGLSTRRRPRPVRGPLPPPSDRTRDGGLRDGGSDRAPPLFEPRQKLGHSLRIGLRKIFRLSDVLAKVVEFQSAVFEELVKFPVSGTNDAARAGAEEDVPLLVVTPL